MNISAALKNPIIHFLLLGALIYWLADDSEDNRIEIHHLQLESARQAMRDSLGIEQLSAGQRLEADLRVVEDELLYREALALGLDDQDHIVRQRMVQKLLFLVEDSAVPEPSEQTLREYFAAHHSEYLIEPSISFEHVYFREYDTAKYEQVASQLQFSAAKQVVASVGDSFALPNTVVDAPVSDLRNTFGAEFTSALLEAPEKSWQGPIDSYFGTHFVNVSAREPARAMTFEQSADQVLEAWRRQERDRTRLAMMQRLLDKYHLELDPGAGEGYVHGINAAIESLGSRSEPLK